MEGPFNPHVTEMRYSKVFVDGASRDKRVLGLETRNAAVDTRATIDGIARDGAAINPIKRDSVGELQRPT